MRLLIVAIALSLVGINTAVAKKVTLASITRSDNSDRGDMNLITTEVEDARKMEIDFGGGIITVNPSDLSGSGKVLLRQKGQNVLTIKSSDFSIYSGGTIKLRYLKEYNLIGSNDYGTYTLTLERDGDTWSLQKGGVKFTRMHAVVYTWGIRRITFQ